MVTTAAVSATSRTTFARAKARKRERREGFTGGIGENSRVVRETTLENLAILGFKIDHQRNEDNGANSNHIITAEGSTPLAMVVPTNEELLIALDTAEYAKSIK